MSWLDDLVRFYDESERQLEDFFTTNPRRWLLFILLLVVTWIVSRLASRLVTRRLVRLRRVEPAVVQLLGRIVVFLAVLVAVFVFSNLIFNANVATLAATLGLVSLAIGFGLQNTIANIAGGISLALDRPFRLGDQIQVGQLLGDVQEIGVRSTRILTQRKEFIVIPNKYLESEPITNYTMVYPEFRLDVQVNVSAEADRQRAEEIMTEVAIAHPVVVRRPPPRVLMRRFLGPVLQLELRCWIAHPRDRALVESDLLKSISDRFEAEEIPIPRSAPGPGVAPRRRERSAGFVRNPPTARRILVPLVASDPSWSRSSYAVALAKALHGHLVGLYVTARGRSADAAEQGAQALHLLEVAANEAGIWFKPILRETSDPISAVLDVAKDEEIDLVILGVARGTMEWRWRREIPSLRAAHLRERGLRALVHDVSSDARLDPRTVHALEKAISDARGDQRAESRPPVVVSPPEPRTSAVPSRPPEEPTPEPRAAQEEESAG